MPLLFESGTYRFTRPRVLVACDAKTQQKRLMARNGFTAQQASARISSQMPLKAKQSLADVVIDNDGSLDATRGQVSLTVKRCLQLRHAPSCSQSWLSDRLQRSHSNSRHSVGGSI